MTSNPTCGVNELPSSHLSKTTNKTPKSYTTCHIKPVKRYMDPFQQLKDKLLKHLLTVYKVFEFSCDNFMPHGQKSSETDSSLCRIFVVKSK